MPVNAFDSYKQAVVFVREKVSGKQKTFCVAVNPEKIESSLKNDRLSDILKKAEMTICDGIGIVIAARLLYGQKIRRCTGADLFHCIMEEAERENWSIFLLGSSAESNKKACEKIKEEFPKVKIAGALDGYFKDDLKAISIINESKPDCVFVAMGSPKQEFWIARNMQDINASFFMGIGGTLDVVSGCVQRAPRLFQKTGTEFLYRLVTNPKRWKRQLVLPVFFYRVLREKIRGGR